VDADALEARLREDGSHRIRALLVVHNETSTGVTSRLPAIRRALDRAAHPDLGRAFRIGHLGDLNDLLLMGTLCGIEMGLELAGVPFRRGGVAAALEHLVQTTAAVAAGVTGR
jgi:aspartate aminotransferase-like enzyme